MVNKLPEKLTLLRKHYGYSQGDIANKLHIPVTEYMNWENGNKICGIQQLKILAELFHVSLDAMADNAKDIVIPEGSMGDSVSIPFLNGPGQSVTQQMDVADNMMPVSSVLPSDTQQRTMQVEKLSDEALGGTKQMGKASEAPKPAPVRPDKKKDLAAKKKKTMIIVGCVCAAAVVLALILIPILKGSGSSVSIGTVNRLAEGDKYTLYVDKNGKLVTNGTFNPSSSFTGLVQVSAYGDHAAGLTNKGKVVTSDNDSEAAGWSDIKMVAAGKDHTVGLKKDGTVVCSGSSNACAVSDWHDVQAVYAGNGVTIALQADGTLATAGSVNAGVSSQSNVKSVSLSDDFLVITKKDGKVTTFAIGSKAVISTSDFTDTEMTAIGTDAILGLKSDGKVQISTSKDDLKTAVAGWSNIKSIAAYKGTYVAVDGNGTVYGAGDNTYNQYPVNSSSASAATGKLSTPKNIQTELTTANLTIKWDTVENANYYEVTMSDTSLNKTKAASNSTSIATSELKANTEYTITVVACSDKSDKYPNSEEGKITYTFKPITKQLDAPANMNGTAVYNIDQNQWIISWDAVTNADSYTVTIDDGAELSTDTNSIAVNLANFPNITDKSKHNIRVIAHSSSSAYTDSEATKSQLQYVVTKVTITISFSDGSYKTTPQKLLLQTGTYRVAQFWPPNATEGAGYALTAESAAQQFEVKDDPQSGTYQFAIVKQ